MNKSDNQESRKPFFYLPAWRYFINFYRGQYRLLLLNAIGSAAQSLLILPTLLLIRFAFDKAIPQKNINLLVLIGLSIFAFRLANSGISLWLRATNVNIIRTVIFNLRVDILRRLYDFSRTFHTRVDQEALHARIVQDTERLNSVSDALVSRLLPSLFTSVGLCLVLLYYNWILLLVLCSIFPLIFLTNRYIATMVKERVQVFQRAFEAFSKGMLFVLRHMDLTKIQSAEREEIERQTENIETLQDTTKRMTYIYAISGQTQQILTGISGILIIIVGGAAIARGSMTIGELLSFYVAAGFLYGQLNNITSSVTDIIAGNESVVTLYSLAQTEETEPYHGREKIRFKGSLFLESISFEYDDQPILRNLNLIVNPHSTVAIIGPNGAGKSTIIKLILGFYCPSDGHLYADKVPYEELDITHLRRSIGVVMQNPTLFSGTILENIGYGAPVFERQQITRASTLALADEFIRQLPEGYDTQVGEDGVLLSGGECQRIAIARALLRRPRLLILDEPTNHLDRDAVGQLMNNLLGLDERPAILIISHDMSVVSHADEVYQLENGILTSYSPVTVVAS